MTDLDANSILPAHQMPDVIITVETQYIEAQSTPADQRYIFAYHVDIYNPSIHPIQLMTRHWSITDGDGQLQEIEGDGVVGETPVISPGDSYQYSSGAVSFRNNTSLICIKYTPNESLSCIKLDFFNS